MISEKDVLRIARLARLHVSPSETAFMADRLNQILGAFHELESIDTEGVEPMYHAVDALTLREDNPQAALSVKEVLQNAADSADDCFRLPRVVDSGA